MLWLVDTYIYQVKSRKIASPPYIRWYCLVMTVNVIGNFFSLRFSSSHPDPDLLSGLKVMTQHLLSLFPHVVHLLSTKLWGWYLLWQSPLLSRHIYHFWWLEVIELKQTPHKSQTEGWALTWQYWKPRTFSPRYGWAIGAELIGGVPDLISCDIKYIQIFFEQLIAFIDQLS